MGRSRLCGATLMLASFPCSFHAFRPPSLRPGIPIASHRRPRVCMEAEKDTSHWQAGLGRSIAVGSLLLSNIFGSFVPGLTSQTASAATDSSRDATQRQIERIDKREQQELKEEVKDLTKLIAKGIVRLPEREGYPMGPERPGALNYALENDNAALLVACYGREGGPVAAKKIPLQGLEFPYAFELTVDNLLFPFTRESWVKDSRNQDDIGVSVLLDLDGQFNTANENDHIGFGISRPVAIAGSTIRRDALIVVQPRTGVKQYSEAEQKVLAQIDFELARQARGASLAQLASENENIRGQELPEEKIPTDLSQDSI